MTNHYLLPVEERDEITRFYKLMLWITIFTLGVIVFGSAVRATDSGMGCPDWPLCNDQLVPSSFDSQVFYEWFHRLIGGVLAILFTIAAFRVGRSPLLRDKFGPQLFAGGLLLAIQIVLGGLTVLHLLDPKIVSAHLVNATLFYGLLLWTTTKARALIIPTRPPIAPRLKWGTQIVLLLIFIQIFLGGMVSSNYAGLSCLDFPSCGGDFWPAGDFFAQLQMVHRGFGVFVLIGSIILALVARTAAGPAPLHRVIKWLPLLILGQIGLGILNVYKQLPDWASVLHLATAELIFTAAILSSAMALMYGRSFSKRVVDRTSEKCVPGQVMQDAGRA